MIATYIYILFFIIAIIFDNLQIKDKYKTYLLLFSFSLLSLIMGLRNPYIWADTQVYMIGFNDGPTLSTMTSNDEPIGYSEKGFFYLSVFLKTIRDGVTSYLLAISVLSFFLLYKFDKKYCIFPLIALCIYLARFGVGRNFMQIRAGLAIPIVLLSIKYIYDKSLWKFLILIFIGYNIHHSALLALPLYLVNYIKLNKLHIFLGILISFIIAGLLGTNVKFLISNSDFVQEMAASYVDENGEKAYSQSLANPMIYYQCCVLFLFTIFERKLASLCKYYYIIRSGYFYSTVLLIVLCQYAILSGRTSTIFATFEMIIIPLFAYLFQKNIRKIYFVVLMMIFSIFFYLNWNPVQLTEVEVQHAISVSK